MSRKKLTRWSDDVASPEEYDLMYPWDKLNNLGYDSWWIDADIHPSSDILRRPSVAKHPSFVVMGEDVFLSDTGISNSSSCTKNVSKKSVKNIGTSTVKSSTFKSGSSSPDPKKKKKCGETYKTLSLRSIRGTSTSKSGEKEPYSKSSSEIKIQDKYLQEKFALYRFLIIPDGNCFYRALAQALVHDQTMHHVLRKETVQFITKNQEDFENIVEEDIDDFLKEAAKEGTWASYIELLAVTRLLDINIIIVTGGFSGNPKVHVTCHHFDPNNDNITPRDSVWLSWLSNGHYDVILDRKLDNKFYEMWLTEKDDLVKSDEDFAKRLAAEQETERSWENGTFARRNSSELSVDKVIGKSLSNSSSSNEDIEWTLESDENLARALQKEEDLAYYDDYV